MRVPRASHTERRDQLILQRARERGELRRMRTGEPGEKDKESLQVDVLSQTGNFFFLSAQ